MFNLKASTQPASRPLQTSPACFGPCPSPLRRPAHSACTSPAQNQQSSLQPAPSYLACILAHATSSSPFRERVQPEMRASPCPRPPIQQPSTHFRIQLSLHPLHPAKPKPRCQARMHQPCMSSIQPAHRVARVQPPFVPARVKSSCSPVASPEPAPKSICITPIHRVVQFVCVQLAHPSPASASSPNRILPCASSPLRAQVHPAIQLQA